MIPDRRVTQSALVATALDTMDHLKERNDRLTQQLADRETAYNTTLNENLARISQLEADLVSSRFAAQSHCHTVERLTKINADLVAAVRAIKRATSDKDQASFMVRSAIGDMCDAALRQAGQT